MLYSDNDATNLWQVRGTGEEHFRYFIENRINYCDSKWYAADYADDYILLRIYTPQDENGNPRTDLAVAANADITVIPFSNMYAGVRYKANGTLYQKRVEANDVVTFDAPNEIFNNTETAIYGASQLSSLVDLSPLYCGGINVSKATKLTELIIGNGTEGYSNPNLIDLSVGTNNLLKVLNIQNCPKLTDPLALSGCPNIEEIYAAGSGITGVELANSGYLKIIELPATIANLSLKNQLYIETLTLEGYDAIKTINIENCPTIDGLDILSKATNVERVRLTNVNWTYDTAAGVLALADRNLAGIDENGANIDYMWIDGKCHIKTLTGAEYLEVKEAFPYMTITYDSLTAELIFMSEDGTTELTRQTIQNGGDGTDPVTAGTISRPSKTSTAQYNFTYSGWSLTSGGVADANALKNVEADRTVYVAFSKELRSYTVKFYNGTTLLQTSTVQYGGDAVYTGSTPVNNSTGNPADFEFYGWSPAPTNIQGDTNCYAQFHDLREITDSWATIAANVANGTATDKYAIGAFKTLDIGEKELPYEFNQGSAVVYDGEIHILGSVISEYRTSHYKWDGTKWVEVSTLPYEFYYGSAVVFNGEIHILGGSGSSSGKKKHYKWNGSEWVSVSTLPYMFRNGVVVVYNNEIHIMGSEESSYYTSHYKWNGSSWSEVGELPYSFYTASGFIYNNEIHMLGSYDSKYNTAHYKYDGSSWISVSTLPQKLSNGHALVIGTDIYMIQWDEFYKYDGTNWDTCPNVPANVYEGGSVVLDGNIYVMGSSVSGNERVFFSYTPETETWSKVGVTESIPMQIIAHNHDELADGIMKWEKVSKCTANAQVSNGGLLTFNNELHALGYYGHYKWDGSSWTKICDIPFTRHYSATIVYKDAIYSFGTQNAANANYSLYHKFDGTQWIEVGTLPHEMSPMRVCVMGEELYACWHGNYFSKFDGTTWTDLPLPPKSSPCEMTTYNNQIHLIYGQTAPNIFHYVWDGSTWEQISLPPYRGHMFTWNNQMYMYSDTEEIYKWDDAALEWTLYQKAHDKDVYFYQNAYRITVYNGEIHVVHNDAHYKLTGASWEQLEYFKRSGYGYPYVLWNNNVYYLYKDTYCYKYDGSNWSNMGVTLPASMSGGRAVVYNNEIHIFANSTSHYKWDGVEWISVSTVPCKVDTNSGYAVVYNDEIHVVSDRTHYKWDGTEWTLISDAVPFRSIYDSKLVVYNNEIHFPGGQATDDHYKYDGTEWILVGKAPHRFSGEGVVVYNDEIHVLGGYSNTVNTTLDTHYKYDGNTWSLVDKLPHALRLHESIVFRGHIYNFGGMGHESETYIYRNPRATLTFLAGNVMKDYRPMASGTQTWNGSTGWNYGGWSLSGLRSYLNSDFLTALPSDLQSAIKTVNKLSDGGYIDHSILKTEDNVWVASVEELGATIEDAVLVSGQGEVYSVFTDNTSRKRTRVGETATKDYWTRSADKSAAERFIAIGGNGAAHKWGTAYIGNISVLPGFCI